MLLNSKSIRITRTGFKIIRNQNRKTISYPLKI